MDLKNFLERCDARYSGTILSATIASGNVEALRGIRSTTFLALPDQAAFRSFGDVQNLRFLEIKINHFGNDYQLVI